MRPATRPTIAVSTPWRLARQAGITLFEFSLLITLFALLAAGVLKGLGMVQAATAKKLATEMQNVQEMVYLYRERYQAIPGDDLFASRHVNGGLNACASACSSTGGDGLITSPWNWPGLGMYEQDESALFWNHVRLAGFAPGDPADWKARNAVGGRIGITSNTNLPTRPAGTRGMYSVCSSRISGDLAAMVDAQLDDGDATRGKVWAAVETSGAVATPTPTTPYTDGSTYTVCMAF
jgi:hypothetical protein